MYEGRSNLTHTTQVCLYQLVPLSSVTDTHVGALFQNHVLTYVEGMSAEGLVAGHFDQEGLQQLHT